jgi:hypothetical protein
MQSGGHLQVQTPLRMASSVKAIHQALVLMPITTNQSTSAGGLPAIGFPHSGQRPLMLPVRS